MGFNETIYFAPPPAIQTSLRLVCAGITHPSPDYKIRRPPGNGLYVLEYVLSGKIHMAYGGDIFTASAGDVYLLQPEMSHDYYSDNNAPAEKIWLNLSGPLMGALCSAYHIYGIAHFPQCPIRQDFEDALSIVRTMSDGDDPRLALHIHKIVADIGSWHKMHPGLKKSREGMRLKDYLDKHWQKNISINELAVHIHKSTAQTMRIFRRDWGSTPYEYIQERRQTAACQYLENTDCPVKELAERLGFNDEFYFSNWFKKRTGISPTQFRRKFRI